MKEGDLIPDIILRSVSADGTKNFGLHDNLKFKRTLIICAPGAFTSTCHIQHLPPFINGANNLMSEKKIDLICCMTTNDPYVLDLWRKELGDSKILFLSDGNNEFLESSKLIRNHEKISIIEFTNSLGLFSLTIIPLFPTDSGVPPLLLTIQGSP